MSEIATLEKLEKHLSHAPGYLPFQGQASRGSALEAYFSEIRYSSFEKALAEEAQYIHTGAKPQKNGAANYKLMVR